MTKLRVLVLPFSYFTDNFIVWVGYDRASSNGSLHEENRKLSELKNYQFQLFLKPYRIDSFNELFVSIF
jgi:hypothetical protein